MGRKTWLQKYLLPLLILAIAPFVQAQTFEAQVVGVDRGDLLTLQHEGRRIELSLYGIRCSGPDVPHGIEARRLAARLALDEDISVRVQTWESDSRVVGFALLHDGTVLNHRLVQNGLAAWDREGAPNDIKLQTLEDSARDLKLGIWSGPASSSVLVEEARRHGPTPSGLRGKASWTAIFSTVLALLVACAMVLFFAGKLRRARERVSAAPKSPTAETRSMDEQSEAVESSRNAVQELLRSLSDFVSDLMENNLTYDSRMKGHKVSIDQAMTVAGLEEIRRLLIREIEEMESTSENYRLQLEHANTTIREQQQILERFKIDARMDFLTKIANRRAFDERLNEECERARRYRNTFSLILIDIDRFKQVNDLHGHLVGDQILRLVAQVLEDQTRTNDFVSRYGGEEFAVLLPEANADQGRYVAEKIRKAVENTSFLHVKKKVKVTVSAGVGEIAPEGDSMEALVDRVDAALYQAKQNGRNRVEQAAH